MNIFALWGEIEINRKKAEQDIKSVEKQAEKSGKKMESSFDKVTKVVGAAIKEIDKYGDKIEKFGKTLSKKAGVPLAVLTGLMGGLAKATANYTSEVEDNAAIVGLSTKSYQELQYAMAQSGLEQGEFIRMMGRVNQRIGFARQGNEKYRKSLEKLGISLADVDAGLVDTEDTFLAMIQYLHEMDDAQQQAAVAGDFFGVMLSRRMMPLIKDGAQSVEELRQRAHDLGLVMDDLAVAKGDLLSDTLDDLSFTAKGLGRIFGSEMHAPLINIGRAITDVLANLSVWLTENPKVVRQIVMWGGAIAGVLGVLTALGTTLIVTGKIVGAIGAIFNLLISKPMLIIAALGLLYVAWENDWLGIRSAVENAWEKIEPVIDAIIEWGQKTISTVWNWAVDAIPAFLTWIKETAWPIINSSVSTAWNWTTGTISAFVTWVKESAWPFLNGVVTTTWGWTTGAVSAFVTWIKDTAWPFLGGTVSTTWQWIKGATSKFIDWIYESAWPFMQRTVSTAWEWTTGAVSIFVTWIRSIWNYLTGDGVHTTWNWTKGKVHGFIEWIKDIWTWIIDGVTTAWDWSLGKVDDFLLWIKDTAWPWINETVTTTWDWTMKGFEKIRDAIDTVLHFLGLVDDKTGNFATEVGGGVGGGGGGARGVGGTGFDGLLDAIYRAEGGAKARVPYGMTGFADAGNKFANERNQALFEQLSQGMVEGSEEYYRTAALVSAQHYWRTFQEKFPGIAGQTFDQLEPEMQQLFVLHMGRWFSPPSAHELNKNWVPNVLNALGHGDAAKEFRAGSGNLIDAWLDGIYAKSGDAEQAANYIAGIFADYLVGQSPPPEGPLSDIDDGGVRVADAWVEGMVEGVEESTPLLTRALDHIKTLLSSVWERVPEDIRLPIENAIRQAEDALFTLDDLYNQLQNAITGGDDPEEQAKSFMDRLKGALDAKLKALDDPLNRFVDMVSSAALHLGEVVKAVSSGDWVGAVLSIIMETESFAKAMELIGKVLAPVVVLFDNVLRPIVEGLLKLWNGIIDALVSISIFGWKPFAGLKSARIEWDDPDSGSGGSDRSSTSGRQISEITGPTRDLLVDLLSPLANFGAIVAPIQDIRNILYERLPNFNAFETDFAAAGAGAMGTSITIENITVQSLSRDGRGLARDLVDDIERELARRINFGIRGRGGR